MMLSLHLVQEITKEKGMSQTKKGLVPNLKVPRAARNQGREKMEKRPLCLRFNEVFAYYPGSNHTKTNQACRPN